MVYFKKVKGQYRNENCIYNTIHYILNPVKNPHNVFHAYGNTPEDIKQTADSFYKVQNAYNKTTCKRIIHCILAFSPKEKRSPREYLECGYIFMDFFEKGTQYVFALHEKDKHGKRKWPHIHILINPIHPKTGKRLYINKATLQSLHNYIKKTLQTDLELDNFPENHV